MKKFFLYAMGLFYVLAGLNHFFSPEFYYRMMPSFVPNIELTNIIAGIVEIILGILVLIPSTRKVACYGIIVLLIVVFPANVQMLLNALNGMDMGVPIIALYARLPIQILFIYWSYALKDYRA
ncbi:hypothetical protein LPTSP4_30050 [Leptospira ryugenii]|uniref:DoxX family protein n=1 Tax=Leptospira ryugenii TaxID=1917863 RepID=A0A2P2E3M2_9LEPT|nr:DoxX family membrane protein [Leptospira ryugenii]GBF51467.1 hypothetical protein LPTSP4_30050 [Leptospira ryugenii]